MYLAIFVQNGYLINKGIAENEIQPAYDNAKLIICISNDAMRCIIIFQKQAQDISSNLFHR